MQQVKIPNQVDLYTWCETTAFHKTTYVNFPTLNEDEKPITCAGVTRHHINSLPCSLIGVINNHGYVLHDKKYYYIQFKKMLAMIEETKTMGECIDDRF